MAPASWGQRPTNRRGPTAQTLPVLVIWKRRGKSVQRRELMIANIGVFLDVFYDQIADARDRSMFPIEIAICALYACYPRAQGRHLGFDVF